VVKSCLPGAIQGGFYPLPVEKYLPCSGKKTEK